MRVQASSEMSVGSPPPSHPPPNRQEACRSQSMPAACIHHAHNVSHLCVYANKIQSQLTHVCHSMCKLWNNSPKEHFGPSRSRCRGSSSGLLWRAPHSGPGQTRASLRLFLSILPIAWKASQEGSSCSIHPPHPPRTELLRNSHILFMHTESPLSKQAASWNDASLSAQRTVQMQLPFRTQD